MSLPRFQFEPSIPLRSRVVFTAIVVLLALVAPAAMVPDALAGMPGTDLRTQRVSLLPVEAPDIVERAPEPESPRASDPSSGPVEQSTSVASSPSPSAVPESPAASTPPASPTPAQWGTAGVVPAPSPSAGATLAPRLGPVPLGTPSERHHHEAAQRGDPRTVQDDDGLDQDADVDGHEDGGEEGHGKADHDNGGRSRDADADTGQDHDVDPDAGLDRGVDPHAGHDHDVVTMDDDDVAAVSREVAVHDALMVGAILADGAAVQVRSGDGDQWSDWIPLVHQSTEHTPDPGSEEAEGITKDASDPVFVGGASRVQFRSNVAADIDVTFVEVNGGEGLEWTPESANSAASAEAAPVVRTRAQWGADESLKDGRVGYSSQGDLRFSVIHHVGGGYWTAGEIANGCARSDDWIRGIYAYHTQSQGWWDIGYNFIVDPCGNTWEGRAGGILEPVVGAHAGGFNDGSVGVLALGTYSGRNPDPVTTAMVDAIEEIVGFKLGMYGVDPGGTTAEVSGGGSARWPSGTAVTLPVLSAHQVSNSTTCPGEVLMSRLFDGSGYQARPLATYVDGVRARLTPTPSMFRPEVQSVEGTYTPATGDFDGDGRDDILWHGPGTARDSLWYGAMDGRFRYASIDVPVRGTPLVGDFDGNGRDDILFYGRGSQSDALWMSTSNGFDRRSVTVRGVYEPFVGDFDGDGYDDIFWYGPGNDPDALWWGGRYGFAYRPRLPVNGIYEPIVGQFDGAAGMDIMWYGPGASYDSIWLSGGDRTFAPAPVVVNGRYLPVSLMRDGKARTDVMWYGQGSSYDTMWTRARRATFRRLEIEVGDLGSAPIPGDFDGDGNDDVLFYNAGPTADTLWLTKD